jgi:hypothetical protein
MILAASLLCASVAFAQKDDANPPASPDQPTAAQSDQNSSDVPTTKLKILVSSNEGKPIGNASVYVRFAVSGGLLHHDKLAELDLKTNQDGSVKVPRVPKGKIMIQVVAKGWHTYGKWYEIDKDEDSVSIQLAPPPHWY